MKYWKCETQQCKMYKYFTAVTSLSTLNTGLFDAHDDSMNYCYRSHLTECTDTRWTWHDTHL